MAELEVVLKESGFQRQVYAQGVNTQAEKGV